MSQNCKNWSFHELVIYVGPESYYIPLCDECVDFVEKSSELLYCDWYVDIYGYGTGYEWGRGQKCYGINKIKEAVNDTLSTLTETQKFENFLSHAE